MRAQIHPQGVSVIPNAVDSKTFMPNPSNRTAGKLTIVVVSRLVYRKGVDLLVDVIPEICQCFPDVHWLIGGDGPKRLDLEEMRERHQLHDRVEMLGNLKHETVRELLTRGDIFLNCSLTEAFCIAIVEAASCGLLVVATQVGGVPEVLPPHMLRLAAPKPSAIADALRDVVPLARARPSAAFYEFHSQVEKMYSWMNVTVRTERVYDLIADTPVRSSLDRIKRLHGTGWWCGKIIVVSWLIGLLLWVFFEWLQPSSEIDIAVPFPPNGQSKLSLPSPWIKRTPGRDHELSKDKYKKD